MDKTFQESPELTAIRAKFTAWIEQEAGAGAASLWKPDVPSAGFKNSRVQDNYIGYIQGWKDAAASVQVVPVEPSSEDYEAVIQDHQRLVRELDVLLNGPEGAAAQASLCDLVAQCSRLPAPVFAAASPLVQAPQPEHESALKFAAELETVLMEIANGERKANRIPMEPMVRLIGYVRNGTTKNASIGASPSLESSK